MRRMYAAWMVAGLTLLTSACGSDHHSSSGGDAPSGTQVAKSALARATTPAATNVPALGSGNRAFAFDLYKQSASMNTGQNVVLSPFSVSTALAMTYAGARNATESQMKATLHFSLDQAPLAETFNATDLALQSRGQGLTGADGTPFKLNVDNSLWAQSGYPVVPAFLDTLAVNYGAGVFLTDFNKNPEGARTAINDWVADKTDDLIPELLSAGSIMADTTFVLTNTVYFDASWQNKFDPSSTQDSPFTKLDGSSVTASMMNDSMRVLYAEGDDYQAAALPYSSALSMVVILPAAGKFTDVESAVDGDWFDTMTQQLTSDMVLIGLPKLDFKSHVSLKPSLRALGMTDAFTGAADFSGLTSQSVVIDDVIHEAVIKVFEAGTIAAGATAVTIRDAAAILNPKTMVMNRPFLFAIWDQPTGEILFLGRVLDPTAM